MNETMINIKRAYKYTKKYKKHLIGITIATISGTIVGIILPLLTAKQIVYLTSNTWIQLITVSIAILLVNCYKAFAAMHFHRKNAKKLIRNTMKDLQFDLGQSILKINQKDIDKNSSGVFIQRVTSDSEKISSFFFDILDTSRNLLSNIGALIATLFINWQVFLYYLFVSIILTIVHIIKTTKKGKKDIELRNKTENVSGLIGELVRGSRDIKMLNARKSFMKTLDKNIEIQNQKKFEMSTINAIYTYVIETLTAILEFILILLLIFLINNNTLTIPLALALFNYKSGIMTVLMEKVSTLLDCIKNFNISCNRVFNILDNKEFKKETFGNKNLNNINGNFEFKNVSFGYNENKKILNNINFKIKNGEMVGFVGKSGAGKTTIFNLLCKLYTADSGEILIENENINELDENSIRGNITIINQNPYIFNLSIRDNLRLVKENLTNDEMIEVCKIACLDEFIETLPNKYDTIVGESGVVLSGGQKQRLAIARALVQKTKIILFDEATSSLDNETQTQIQKTIDKLKNQYKYTILIIAHRLSTIVDCDRIMILNNGKIDDQGNHQELLERNSIYHSLYNSEILK